MVTLCRASLIAEHTHDIARERRTDEQLVGLEIRRRLRLIPGSAERADGYQRVRTSPPSTTTNCPVTKLARVEQRNAATAAISSG